MAAAALGLVCYLCDALVCNSYRVVITLHGVRGGGVWGGCGGWRVSECHVRPPRLGARGVEVVVRFIDLPTNHAPKRVRVEKERGIRQGEVMKYI